MCPPDDDSCKPLPSCEVDLEAKTIRFFACRDQEAMISAAEKRFALVTGQLDARSGLTNRERRALNREANILRRWLFPDAKTPRERRLSIKMANNLQRASGASGRKTIRRRAREARRDYREQHTLEKRPDYTPSPVISQDQLKRMRQLVRVRKAKQAWFERKHGRKVNESACRCAATKKTLLSAEMAHTVV
jgi:hypothetical protein